MLPGGPGRRLSDIRGFLLDMDGTFLVDEQLLPGAKEVLARLEAQGRPYLFLTNNSSARAESYLARFARLGIPQPAERILTSGQATATYLLDKTPYRRIYLLGTPELQAELSEAGLIFDDQRPECVVLGFDKTLTYARLSRACLLLAAGLPYVATHPDNTCITRDGLIPDTGAFIAAIERVTGRLPFVVGKPEPEMVAAALARLGTSAETTALVGDQLDTDLTMAQRAGLYGVLVLSGETSRTKLEGQQAVRPQLVLEGVAELLPLLPA